MTRGFLSASLRVTPYDEVFMESVLFFGSDF